MLDKIARLAVSRPKTVVAVALLMLITALPYAGQAADRLSGGGFWSESSESKHAAALLAQRFHAGKPNVVILATDTRGRSVDDPDGLLRPTISVAVRSGAARSGGRGRCSTRAHSSTPCG